MFKAEILIVAGMTVLQQCGMVELAAFMLC